LKFQEYTGYFLALGVLIVFFLHTFLNSWYQRVEKVKNRALLQITYMLFIGGLLHLPFMSFDDFLSVPITVLLVTVLNGVLASGFANFFYLEVSRYLQQHSINTGMSFILPLVVLIEYFLYGQQQAIYYLIFLLIFTGVIMTVRAEKRSATFESVDEKALSS